MLPMKALVLGLLGCLLSPAYAQQKGYPSDGNGLLDACSVVVESADSPSSFSSLSANKFAEKMGQLDWCAGYLQAVHDMNIQNDVNLAFLGMLGVTLQGPDKIKQYAFDSLRGACIPDKAPILQLARVLVKWLREHPERLHELSMTLTTAAMKDAFPCKDLNTQDTAKPTTVQPDKTPK
jgi:Rap1a immunity proteins